MYAKIGRISPSNAGANPFRADYLGGLITSTAGDYKDITLAGRHFFAYMASSNVALYSATAAIGIQVYNPANSGVNLVLHKWSCIVWASSASMTGLMLAIGNAFTAAPVVVTPLTLTGRTNLSGATAVTGVCAATGAATILATPVPVWPLFHNTAGINTVGAEVIGGDLQGSFAFAPGTVAIIGALGAAGVTVNLGLTYEEVPIG